MSLHKEHQLAVTHPPYGYLSYISSGVFAWDPKSKREELFNKYSRFLLVTPHEDDSDVNPEETILAYGIFRFERDEGRNVVYVYANSTYLQQLKVTDLVPWSDMSYKQAKIQDVLD